MKNVLVTGGAGFIGSNFIRLLLEKEADITLYNLDALTYSGSLENLRDIEQDSRYHFVKGDICDPELVEKLIQDKKIETIVHFAAESHVDRSILGPGLFVQTNIIGTYTMIEAAKKVWLNSPDFEKDQCRFHHISTDEVFGTLNPGDPAWVEETPYAPSSPYSASKASSDHLVRSYAHTYGLPVTITNCSNNYGPYQFPEKLIPLIILNALEGKPLPVYGDGQQIRDWLHVEDHCEAIYLVLKKGQVGSSYNIGGSNQPANLTIVETICDIMDELSPAQQAHRSLITYVKDRPGHDRRYAMDSSKIESELGWQRKHTLKEGLLDTVKWYLAHPDWVKAIREQSNFSTWMQQNYTERK
ncbi:dTDP-glucose 4,6-dehydratase [bioreactor metagenome]|uniref:dTDP-glucose 4,6-dehydratase n=1 Tax=bioreactor metagenome TaxID=1076179 RepID=A0A645BHC5_9ZZZZ